MEGSSTDLISSLLPLVALFAILLFIIRPQQKQAESSQRNGCF